MVSAWWGSTLLQTFSEYLLSAYYVQRFKQSYLVAELEKLHCNWKSSVVSCKDTWKPVTDS